MQHNRAQDKGSCSRRSIKLATTGTMSKVRKHGKVPYLGLRSQNGAEKTTQESYLISNYLG